MAPPTRNGTPYEYVDLEQAEDVERLLEHFQVRPEDTPIVLCNGSLETPEFLRQSREFAAALQAAGKPVRYIVAPGYNHYETGETIGQPYAVIGRAAMEMMKINV